VVNFVKTHSLIGDHVDGNLVHFVNQYASSFAVDTIRATVSNEYNTDSNNVDTRVNVYYLGTGRLFLFELKS
jgi:hypothetical protein